MVGYNIKIVNNQAAESNGSKILQINQHEGSSVYRLTEIHLCILKEQLLQS